MNKILKIITLCCAIAFSTKLEAQVYYNQDGCAIQYSYDAAGNRIKRKWTCWTANQNYKIVPVKKEQEIEMKVYPNPASTFVSVNMNQELENALVELQDITGKIISKKVIMGNTIDFDTRYLAQGTYMIVLRRKDSNIVMVRKFVKE